MESFFSLLQNNVLNRCRWATREQLRIAIVIWIECTYHRRRRQPRLGRSTPIGFESIMNTAVALAARQLSPIRAAAPVREVGEEEVSWLGRFTSRAGLQSMILARRAPVHGVLVAEYAVEYPSLVRQAA